MSLDANIPANNFWLQVEIISAAGASNPPNNYVLRNISPTWQHRHSCRVYFKDPDENQNILSAVVRYGNNLNSSHSYTHQDH